MSRRIEVELTSDKGDGTFTWRAAGAREPKGVLDASLVPDGVSIGDTVKVDANFDIDGIEVIAVLAPKSARAEPERLELLGTGSFEGGVTTSLVSKKGGKGGRDGKGRKGKGKRRGRPERGSADRPDKPKLPPRPKPPRLKVARTHRDAWRDGLSDEQKPVADQMIRGGVPGVRKAAEEQNEAAKAEGQPPVPTDALVAMAEQLAPKLRVAEWRDRAEAAVEQIDVVDLRDLRSVVSAAETGAKGPEGRELSEKLRAGLAARVDKDHAEWLGELAELLADDRVVRALNVSSRPVKAGAPLPTDLADRLATAAGAALTDDVGQKRWSTVLEAVALSPVRQQVEPAGIPGRPGDELLDDVRQHSMQVPQIAAKFGIEPTAPKRRGRRRGSKSRGSAPPPAPASPTPGEPAPGDPSPGDKPPAGPADATGAKIPPPPPVSDPPADPESAPAS